MTTGQIVLEGALLSFVSSGLLFWAGLTAPETWVQGVFFVWAIVCLVAGFMGAYIAWEERS